MKIIKKVIFNLITKKNQNIINNIGFYNYFKSLKCKTLKVNFCGQEIIIRSNSTDLEVLISSKNEFKLLKNVVLDVPPESVIVDAGAYIGFTSIILSQIFPNNLIFAIEPETENFNLLIENTKKIENIKCLNCALVSQVNEKVRLINRKTGAWGFSVINNFETKGFDVLQEKVKTITLEEITSKFSSIYFLKLDIEGAEKDIIENSKILKQIPIIFVEIHERIVPGVTYSLDSFSKNMWVIKDDYEKYLLLKNR